MVCPFSSACAICSLKICFILQAMEQKIICIFKILVSLYKTHVALTELWIGA